MRDEPILVEPFEQRLVLARWTAFHTLEGATAFRSAIVAAVSSCAPSAVICADWRRCRVVPPAVAEVLAAMLTRANPRVERSAVLIDPRGAVFGLQAERLVREAAHPARRTFQDAAALETWLGELLTLKQSARVRAFLAG